MRESQIRKLIVKECQVLGLDGAEFIHEFQISGGRVRADVVALKNGVHGIEIKSKFDNLNRLKHQLAGYAKVFNSVTLVCDSKFEGKIDSVIPDWFGISIATESELIVKRRAQLNPLIRPEFILGTLTKKELAFCATEFIEGVKPATKAASFLRFQLNQSLSPKQIYELYEQCLRTRFRDSSE
ncbi:sce7726 family protein [Rheinheimera oceanensis]|uniref:sce7726 family protein n=1 Tax=Rheinheimera oceanensis TaxID=2817449 RepID=UPI001BFE56D3|nr:sce7726 family protein [Rheinheimera oceanensis]